MSVQKARSENTMMVSLVTFSRSGGRKDFALKGSTTVIGRRMDADLRIPISSISRAHCEIVVSGDEVLVRDLDSSNGTFLNDSKITEAVLSPGDRIRVGPIVFVVQIDGQPREIGMASVSGKPAATGGRRASPDTATTLGAGAGAEGADFDLDKLNNLDELDVDDLSDLDLEELDELGSGDMEELTESDPEDLSDDDVVDEDGGRKP